MTTDNNNHDENQAGRSPVGADPYGGTPQSRFDWRHVPRVLLERKWIALTTCVVVVTGTLIYNFKQTPLYRTSARLEVLAEPLKILSLQDVAGTTYFDQEAFNTQINILRSRTLAEQAAKSLNLDQNRDFLPGAGPGTDVAGALQSCISVQPVRSTRLVDITAEHPNPKVAALLANGVANECLRQNLQRKMSTSVEAVRWLREQADDYKTKLDKSEQALQAYREKAQTVSLDERQNIVTDKLKELSGAVTKAKTDRLAAETELHQLQSLLKPELDPSQLPAVAADKEVSSLRQQLGEKQIAIAVLRERYMERHPTMIAAVTELNEIQSKLARACRQAIEAINANYLLAKAKEESLQQALREQEQLAIDLDRKLTEYNTLKRNAELDRQLYEALLNRMKETGVTGKLETNDLRLVDPALPPSAPYKPRTTTNVLRGLVLGVLAGIGLSFLVDKFDDKIKTHDDVEALGLTLLSAVPHIDGKEARERACIAQTDTHGIAAESFRNLRASIELTQAAKGAKSFLVVSSDPAEGKSLVASNYAIVLAQNGHRTLLVDADLHHPVQHRQFNLNNEGGLAKFLADSTSLTELIQHTDIANLDFVAAGRTPQNAQVLLASSRMRDLLARATQEYDRIVIDCAPISVMSDPLVLLPHIHGVLFVIHFNKVRWEIIGRALQKLSECNAPVVGAIINNVESRGHGYYYYHYPYGYSRYHQQKKEEAG